jgi:hypothetical protein
MFIGLLKKEMGQAASTARSSASIQEVVVGDLVAAGELREIARKLDELLADAIALEQGTPRCTMNDQRSLNEKVNDQGQAIQALESRLHQAEVLLLAMLTHDPDAERRVAEFLQPATSPA